MNWEKGGTGMSYQRSESVDTPTATPATRPQSLRNAVWLMYLGALLSLISIIFGVTSKSSVLDDARREALEKGDAPADVDNAVNVLSSVYTGMVIVGGIIATLLWLWMAWANGKGRKWARILATVLFAISTLGVIGAITGTAQTGALNMWLSIATWLVGLLAIFFLWRRDSSEYFNLVSSRSV